MTSHFASAVAISIAVLSTQSDASISNKFLTLETNGIVRVIDADTYETTTSNLLIGFQSINEIEYIGNNTILFNSGNSIGRFNLETGFQEVLFNTNTGFESGFFHSDGLAISPSGDIIYNVVQFNQGHLESHVVTLDANLNSYTSTRIDSFIDPFDLYETGDNLLIAPLWVSEEIVVLDSTTGIIQSRFSTEVGISSLFETDEGLFAMSQIGLIYQVDLDSQSLSLQGQISPFAGSFIGATSIPSNGILIPAPSSLALLGGVMLMGTRRRKNS